MLRNPAANGELNSKPVVSFAFPTGQGPGKLESIAQGSIALLAANSSTQIAQGFSVVQRDDSRARSESGGKSTPSSADDRPADFGDPTPPHWSWTVSLVVFLLLVGGGLSLDLWSKSIVFQHYWPYYQNPQQWADGNGPHWWIDGVLGIQTSTNGGALFGMMQGYTPVFVSLSFLALLGILIWLFLFHGWLDRWLLCCLGLITGGILGNLYDRVGLWHSELTPPDFHYHVRDWIHFRLSGVPLFDPWPNFNVADSLLVVGVGLMLIQSLFFSPPERKPAD